MENRKRRILVVGDFNCFTGFANVNHNIFDRLYNDFDIHICASNYNGLRPYHPSLFPVYGTRSFYGIEEMPIVMKKVEPDIVYTLNDGFVTPDFARCILDDKRRPAWVAHVVFDALPIRDEWAKQLRYASAIVFPTRWQAEEFAKVYPHLESRVIYHGVDTKIYHPIPDSEIEDYKIKFFGSKNTFVFGMVAKNFQRKRFPELILAFKMFKDKNLDSKMPAKLFFHTDRPHAKEAYNFMNLCDQVGMPKNCVLLTSNPAMTEEEMNVLYNTFDVNCLISIGEGYGLPINHACAVGKPSLVCANSVQIDLAKQTGAMFLCEENPFLSYFCEDDNYDRRLPNIASLAEAIENIYLTYTSDLETAKTAIKQIRTNALCFAKKNDWETRIVPLWKSLFEKIPIGIDRKVVEI